MAKRRKEIVAIRSLQASNPGIFPAHRAAATSKQPAIQINGEVARVFFLPRNIVPGTACLTATPRSGIRRNGLLAHSTNPRRTGGSRARSLRVEFGVIDSLYFVLFRSVELDAGSLPVSMTFITRAARPNMHARISSMVAARLKHNMAMYGEATKNF
jgi:hypothetical protein